MAKIKYYVIDSNYEFRVVCSSAHLSDVLHEFLSRVNDELNVLIKYDMKISADKLLFSNLYIIKCKDIKQKHHPVILDTYRFDANSSTLLSSDSIRSKICTDLMNKIKENIKKVTMFSNSNSSTDNDEVESLIPDTVSLTVDSEESWWQSKLGFSNPNNTPVNDKDDKDDKEELVDKKNKIQDEISQIESKLQNDTDLYVKNLTTVHEKRKNLRNEKDKEDEKKRVFKVDKKIYFQMKEQILAGKLTEENVPELFASKYPIFKFMEDNSLLDSEDEDEYDTYRSFYDEIHPPKVVEKDYVHHDSEYQNVRTGF